MMPPFGQKLPRLSLKVKRRTAKGSLIVEFGPVLFILFILVLIPLIDLISLATGAVTALLETNEAVSSAAVQEGYANSLNAMYTTCAKFFTSGFAKFTGLTPQYGYAACGMDLYIRTTPMSGAATLSPPNKPLSPPIDLTDNVYEFVGVNHCTIRPLISMEKIPILGSVPGLGQPAILQLSATHMVEHPTGLAYVTQSSGGSGPQPFPRLLTSANPPANVSGYNYNWRDPDIFQQIANAGQTVVSQNVVVIYANQPWQSSGVSLASGQTAWIDTNAVGLWNVKVGGTFSDANGGADLRPPWAWTVDSTATGGSLIGFCGSNPPTPVQANGGTTSPNMFVVGDTLTNYQLPAPGSLSFMINDNHYQDNTGTQVVRIIVTHL
jgi:hypothetical protein